MTTHNISGFKTYPPLKHWDSMLEEWTFLIERYSRIAGEGDNCFGYSERANIGVMAGAAWRSGRIALEEFGMEKGTGQRRGNGRADLWIMNDWTSGRNEYIEAKFSWISIRTTNRLQRIKDCLAKATEAAKHTRSANAEYKGVGMAFLPLYTPNRYAGHLPNQIMPLIDELSAERKYLGYHAIAWCFPAQDQAYRYEQNVTPGIVVLAASI